MFPIILLFQLDISSCDSGELAGFVLAQDHARPQTSPSAAVDRRQRFRANTPLKQTYNTTAGLSIVLRCEVDNQIGDAQWMKDGVYMFSANRSRHPDSNERMSLEGDPANGVHNLKLDNANVSDSAKYECQITPENQHSQFLRSVTILRVVEQPLSPPQAPTTTTTSGAANGSSSANNIAQRAADTFSAADTFPTTAYKGSQLQARDVASPTKLPGSSYALSATGNQLAPSAFITPHASSVYKQQNAAGPLGLIISWPYLLLFLAGLLMLANMYMIYSLVKRHKRRKKEGSFSNQDNSLESGSNGGSSTSSAGTGSSRLGTVEQLTSCEHVATTTTASTITGLTAIASQATPTTSIEVPEMQNTTFLPGRICMAQHQHAWNGQEFVAIDSNGWVLEI